MDHKSSVTLPQLIVEMMPFPKELVDWCNSHSEFLAALKNVYAEKFISLGAVVTSYSPNYPNDEVIGIYTYDYQRKTPLFKQDFIVNKGKLNKEFILFARNPGVGSSRYVKDINDFFRTYGRGGYYKNSHHLSFEELPDELKDRAGKAIRLAGKIKGVDLRSLQQEHVDKIYQQVKSVKNGEWYVTKRLKKSS